MVKTFKFHSDSGHGWLAVKINDIIAVGININDISGFSYWKGNTVYLEEDGDCFMFIKAYHTANGKPPTIKELPSKDRSPIRSYEQFYHSRPII